MGWLVLLSVFQFFSVSAFSQLERTWEFDVPGEYEVSDETLIRANTNHGGRAELILQEELLDQTTIPIYLTNSTLSGLRLGAERILKLTKDGTGLYASSGVYRSRVLDKGLGTGDWSAFFAKASNDLHLNNPSGWTGNENGLRRLYRFDNNAQDAVSGDVLQPRGGSVSFTPTAVIGSHAASFAGGGLRSSYHVRNSIFRELLALPRAFGFDRATILPC